MKNLSDFVLDTIKNTNLRSNLSNSQRVGLNSLKQKDNLHISVSDKCGDFFVTAANAYKVLTVDHIKENNNVYKFVPPTTHRHGVVNQVKCLTEVTYKNQLNAKSDSIEKQCNELWKEIVEMRSVDSKFANLFYGHNTTLPTLYTLVKPIKYNQGLIYHQKD